MNLSSRDLRAVIALIEERNFTRAAERMHLSQSAFSTLIQGVEESLGARLFERSTRNVVFTPEGRLFEESARRVLTDFDGMLSNFRDHASGRRGRVAIAALPSLAAGWLPGVLAEFRSLYPAIELALVDGLSEQCLASVRSGRVEFALARRARRMRTWRPRNSALTSLTWSAARTIRWRRNARSGCATWPRTRS